MRKKHVQLNLMKVGKRVALCSLALFLLTSCEELQQQQQQLPSKTREQIRKGNFTDAINTLTSPPQADCVNHLDDTNPSAPEIHDWESYKANSQTSMSAGYPIDNTPFGRVEWFNGTRRSVPGGGGMRNSQGDKYLSKEMLDILPYIALAHKDVGLATRMAHTTDGTHSRNSKHYTGDAMDIDPSPDSKRVAAFNKIVSRLRDTINPSTGKPIGCGYFVYDERSHIHVSYKGPSYSGCPGSKRK